jgi:hypothetical protein
MRLIPEGLLQKLYPRQGDQPPPSGLDRDRWGKAKLLTPGMAYTFVQTSQQPIIGAIGLQVAFSLDNIIYTPFVPGIGSNSVVVKLTKAIDIKSGAFIETYTLSPNESMPFCTLIAKALTVEISIPGSVAPPGLWVHCAACPVETLDCDSVINPATVNSWSDVESLSVASNTVGEFVALAANPTRKQVIIQNNSAAPLYLGFGSFIPAIGPPPASNMILPPGINAIWESFPWAFTGAVNAVFGPGGSATTYATFTQGI